MLSSLIEGHESQTQPTPFSNTCRLHSCGMLIQVTSGGLASGFHTKRPSPQAKVHRSDVYDCGALRTISGQLKRIVWEGQQSPFMLAPNEFLSCWFQKMKMLLQSSRLCSQEKVQTVCTCIKASSKLRFPSGSFGSWGELAPSSLAS